MRHRSRAAVGVVVIAVVAVLLLGLAPNGGSSVGTASSSPYRGPRLFLPMAPVGVTDGRVSLAGMWIKEVDDDVFVQRLSESGAAWARTFITWAEVEPVRTDPPTYHWAATDRAVRLLRQRNIEPLIGIADAPPWVAIPTCGPIRDPAMQTRWLQFVQAAVSRYRDGMLRVRYWQLTNEPDFIPTDMTSLTGGGLGGGCWGHDPAAYGQMLQMTYPVIKAANPQAQVVFGALAADACGGFNCQFFRDVIDPSIGGAAHAFDIVSFNHYATNRRNWERFGPGLIGKAEGFRAMMRERNLAKPIIVAEMGFWHGGSSGRTAYDLSVFLPQELTWALVDQQRNAPNGVMAGMWFTLRNSTVHEDQFGLVDGITGAPNLGFLAYQQWVKQLSGWRLIRDDSEPTYGQTVPAGARRCSPNQPFLCDTLHHYVFAPAAGAGQRWVMWIDPGPTANPLISWTTAKRTIRLPADQTVMIEDRFGAPIATRRVNGDTVFTLGGEPVYVTLRPTPRAPVGPFVP